MIHPQNNFDHTYKHQIFEKLVAEVNKIDKTAAIDLCSKGYELKKDALAFLVEGLSQLYVGEQGTIMLQGLIDRLKEFGQNNQSNEAHIFLNEQISTLYQANLAKKTEEAPVEKRKGLEAFTQMYASIVKYRHEQAQTGKSIDFGGVNRTFLPEWYIEHYVNTL